ncbi:MAG: FHA domain-containing protein [bacterium]|nr:FHA domain-containing protein [bacterium]
MFGELIPVGGGDPIPLLKESLRVGRRENCDIVLRFPNVSAHHCVLSIDEGYWFIKDLNSQNGVKVNGSRVVPDTRKRIDPGDTVGIARHKYELVYQPADLGAVGVPPADDQPSSVLKQSLLERAGLQRREDQEEAARGYDRYGNQGDKKNRRRLE